jgi:hypothetical protein
MTILKKNRTLLSKKGSLSTLHPFLARKHLLRLGSQLQNYDLNSDQRQLLILPAMHHITELIVEDRRNLHASGQ